MLPEVIGLRKTVSVAESSRGTNARRDGVIFFTEIAHMEQMAIERATVTLLTLLSL